MNNVLAIALKSMHQDMVRLDSIAQNMANATTPGYKREVVGVRPFGDLVDMAAGPTQSAPAALETGVQMLLDAQPGALKLTGRVFDVALTGEGFFEIATPAGPAYTRQGNFQVDARGRLVSAAGYPVMGKNGEIFLTTQTPVVDGSGYITEPDATTGPAAMAPRAPIAQLKVVRFEKPEALQRLGAGLLSGASGATVATDTQVQLRQSALEGSNVDSLHEMTQLVQTMRHFESVQKAVQGYDEIVGTAIRKLGEL